MGLNCCDICEIKRCLDEYGNPLDLDSPYAACNYDNKHEYHKFIDQQKMKTNYNK